MQYHEKSMCQQESRCTNKKDVNSDIAKDVEDIEGDTIKDTGKEDTS